MEPFRNVIFSLIRTLVPGAVGGALAWVARKTGFIIDEQTQAMAVTAVAGVAFGLYYTAVRVVETYVTPKFSWFLGDFRKGRTEPVYALKDTAVVIPPANPPQE